MTTATKVKTAPKANPNILLALGVTARDRVSGITGIIIHKAEMLTGNVQWAIQPRGDGEKMPEGFLIDYHMLEVLDEGVSKLLPPVDSTVTARLGNEVEDLLTGLKGVATEQITFQNGCVYFWVQPKMGKKDVKVPEAKLIPHSRLKVTAEGALKQPVPVPAKASEPAKRPPGGPTRRAPSMRG